MVCIKGRSWGMMSGKSLDSKFCEVDDNIKNNLIEGIKAKHRLGMVLRTCFDEICTALLK